MPTRRDSAPEDLTPDQERELCDPMAAVLARQMDDSAFASVDAKRAAWQAHGERLTRAYVAENPGKRPAAWWQHEAEMEGAPLAGDVPGVADVEEFREIYGSPFHAETAFLAEADLLSEAEVAALSEHERAVLETLEGE